MANRARNTGCDCLSDVCGGSRDGLRGYGLQESLAVDAQQIGRKQNGVHVVRLLIPFPIARITPAQMRSAEVRDINKSRHCMKALRIDYAHDDVRGEVDTCVTDRRRLRSAGKRWMHAVVILIRETCNYRLSPIAASIVECSSCHWLSCSELGSADV